MSKKKITKEQIVTAAIQVADSYGIANITLKDIAAKLQIKPPSIYNHVSGLEEIIALIAVKGLEELYQTLLEASAGITGKEAFVSLAHSYRNFALKNPSMHYVTQNTKLWKSDIAGAHSEKILNLLKTILVGCEVKEENMVHIIRMLRSFLYGFTQLEYMNSFELDNKTDESFEIGIELIIKGFLTNNEGGT